MGVVASVSTTLAADSAGSVGGVAAALAVPDVGAPLPKSAVSEPLGARDEGGETCPDCGSPPHATQHNPAQINHCFMMGPHIDNARSVDTFTSRYVPVPFV
jgi:hypothetical protein